MTQEEQNIDQRMINIIKAGGKWYDPSDNTIYRRMKNPEKLLEFADEIAKLYFIPNNFDGRGAYQGRYEFRDNLWGKDDEGGYYAIKTDSRTGKDTIVPANATVRKHGVY